MADPAVRMLDPELKMFVLHAKYPYGPFYLALVPAALNHDEIQAAFDELNLDQVAELKMADDQPERGRDMPAVSGAELIHPIQST